MAMELREDEPTLTKDMIFDKVMRGEHLTAEEKRFVLDGYRTTRNSAATNGQTAARDAMPFEPLA